MSVALPLTRPPPTLLNTDDCCCPLLSFDSPLERSRRPSQQTRSRPSRSSATSTRGQSKRLLAPSQQHKARPCRPPDRPSAGLSLQRSSDCRTLQSVSQGPRGSNQGLRFRANPLHGSSAGSGQADPSVQSVRVLLERRYRRVHPRAQQVGLGLPHELVAAALTDPMWPQIVLQPDPLPSSGAPERARGRHPHNLPRREGRAPHLHLPVRDGKALVSRSLRLAATRLSTELMLFVRVSSQSS